jgi:glutamate/aspartate transport system substrate-binding protein
LRRQNFRGQRFEKTEDRSVCDASRQREDEKPGGGFLCLLSSRSSVFWNCLALSFFICVAGGGASPDILARERPGTLEKIKSTGSIALGVRKNNIPFSYRSLNGKPIGYSIDLCHKVTDAIRIRLSMPGLTVRYHFVDAGNRISILKSGEIDLVCDAASNTTSRRGEVDFSVNYFYSGVRMATRRNSGIRDFGDIKDGKLVTTARSTSERLLKRKIAEEAWGTELFLAKNHAQSFRMLRSGRAAAFVMDDVLLAGLIATSPDLKAYHIVGSALRVEPYALMLRKGDTDFKALIDDTLSQVMRSGEAEKIYARWFMKPIPPRGINLNMPMSHPLREAFRNPADQRVE